jgi:hypothetical protein
VQAPAPVPIPAPEPIPQPATPLSPQVTEPAQLPPATPETTVAVPRTPYRPPVSQIPLSAICSTVSDLSSYHGSQDLTCHGPPRRRGEESERLCKNRSS